MRSLSAVLIPDSCNAERLGWAQRLARRLIVPGDIDTPPVAVLRLRAEARLRALFDAAYLQANEALEQAGVGACISLTGSPHLRCYSVRGPDGTERELTVEILVAAEDNQLSGGAYVGSNVGPRGLALVAVVAQGEPRWQVARTGRPFTSALVHDLFLSTFADDAEATARLAPLMCDDQASPM